MTKAFSSIALCIALILLGCSKVKGQLNSTGYDSMCPNVSSAAHVAVQQAIVNEAGMNASFLRLQFHDCFKNGCDGLILLDNTVNMTDEKIGGPNNNSVRGFDVIDTIKSHIEAVCSGVVPCTDILAIAARDSVVAVGGPTWIVQLGRNDSLTASLINANTNILPPTSNLTGFISPFSNQVLYAKDNKIALFGGHTIGQARCTNFRGPIYKNLRSRKGLLQTNERLFKGVSTDSQVNKIGRKFAQPFKPKLNRGHDPEHN